MDFIWNNESSDNYFTSTATVPPKNKIWVKNKDYLLQNNFYLYMDGGEWKLKFHAPLLGPYSDRLVKKRDQILSKLY